MAIKKIGILTSGGDAPGMNACIRAVVRTAIYHGLTPVGIERGYCGLIENQMHEMDLRSVGDIINRGGNDVYITVFNGTKDMEKLDTDVTVHSDGRTYTVPAGSQVCLKPGQSITITPYLFHDFVVPKTGGSVLLGEVSMCNDDENDNYFYERMGRFPTIEEDEPIYRYLCTEYPEAE